MSRYSRIFALEIEQWSPGNRTKIQERFLIYHPTDTGDARLRAAALEVRERGGGPFEAPRFRGVPARPLRVAR